MSFSSPICYVLQTGVVIRGHDGVIGFKDISQASPIRGEE
jgi:hypothetical protein